MYLARALRTSLASICLTALFLLMTGVAWSMVEVENRSQPWSAQGSASSENTNLELLKKLEFLQQEMQELRGKVEEQNYQVQQLQEHQKKLYLDLDRRLREGGTKSTGVTGISLDGLEDQSGIKIQGSLDASSPAVAPSAAVAPNVAADPNASMQPTSLNVTYPSNEEVAAEEKAYRKAYHLIQIKDYDGALLGFRSLVKTYPHGKYLPNAQYWLGEIYLVKGELDSAAEAFNMVYRNYLQHPKAADSLLKLGYVEYSKGDWKRSQSFLNQVKSQFPGTTSAQLANTRLQKMRQEGHI